MKSINAYYISIVLIGVFLWFVYSNQTTTEVSFFGFAETRETEINYNHSVLVNRILVVPGQKVQQGDVLLNISRIKSKETLQEQEYLIKELNSKISKWNSDKDSDLKILENEYNVEIDKLNLEKANLQKELDYQRDLINTIDSNVSKEDDNLLLKRKIDEIVKHKQWLSEQFNTKKKAIETEKLKGTQPLYDEIQKLRAEKDFEDAHRVQNIEVKAPTDGLIGNIQCKAAEHITAYKTLLSFYEPNPSYIKAYVHENLILSVNLNDKFKVQSIKDPTYFVEGTVSGLGSRIVEIPERLRKHPDLKTYGREVTIKIEQQNSFLQKEKVALDLLKDQ